MTRGFLVVDKPGGMTSHDVVARIRRASGIKKVGHAGTLDPMATGVLVVGIGPVTRLIRFVQDQPKEYLATAQFGVATDTLDADGGILDRVEMGFTPEDLEEVAERFRGDIMQVPPMVSALKHQGRRLYDLAREGQTIEREPRPVTIHELEITSVGPGPYPEVEFRVVCSSGTYVRVLADDMARALGGFAHLTALRRTRVGSLGLDRAIATGALDSWREHLIPPADALGDLPGVVVDPDLARAVRQGTPLVGTPVMAAVPAGEPYRVLDEAGELLAVYERRGERAAPVVVLPS
jgi:tRNA pseudouridine55 synthase|nr:MAG: tRNA pseudouridine(55) synthase TruB [Actinomycetota bacterium]